MSLIFTEAKRGLLAGDIDLDANDIRVALCMTNSTIGNAGTEDVTNLGGLVLDEMDGAGYARQVLAAKVVTADNPNNRGLFDANDSTFAALGAGTRQIKGALVYKHVGADAVNVPIAWFDAAPFPFAANGTDLILRWNAAGILAAT